MIQEFNSTIGLTSWVISIIPIIDLFMLRLFMMPHRCLKPIGFWWPTIWRCLIRSVLTQRWAKMITYWFLITVYGSHQCKFALLTARSRNCMFLTGDGELRFFKKSPWEGYHTLNISSMSWAPKSRPFTGVRQRILPSTSLNSLLMLCIYSLYTAPSGEPAAIKYPFRFSIKTGPALGLFAAYCIRSMVAKFTFGSKLSPMLCSTFF